MADNKDRAIARVNCMMANLFKIKKNSRGEKGIFATRFIPRGTITDFRCSKCSYYSKEEFAKLSKKKKEFVTSHEVLSGNGMYTKLCDRRMLYDNHSCNANILGANVLDAADSGKLGIAVRDIKKGEEGTCDYRLNKDEVVHFEGGCKCGSKNCIKNKTFRPPPSKELQRFWDRRINAALKAIPAVKQPSKAALLRDHPELSYLFEKGR